MVKLGLSSCRYSFELRDSEADSSPSSLVRVVRHGNARVLVGPRARMTPVICRQVKLEEGVGARVNPAIGEIRSDEGQSATPPFIYDSVKL